jgi:hypothetical protein
VSRLTATNQLEQLTEGGFVEKQKIERSNYCITTSTSPRTAFSQERRLRSRCSECRRCHQHGLTGTTDVPLCPLRNSKLTMPHAEIPQVEYATTVGSSVEKSREYIDRRISVAPMMDWTDSVIFPWRFKGLCEA